MHFSLPAPLSLPLSTSAPLFLLLSASVALALAAPQPSLPLHPRAADPKNLNSDHHPRFLSHQAGGYPHLGNPGNPGLETPRHPELIYHSPAPRTGTWSIPAGARATHGPPQPIFERRADAQKEREYPSYAYGDPRFVGPGARTWPVATPRQTAGPALPSTAPIQKRDANRNAVPTSHPLDKRNAFPKNYVSRHADVATGRAYTSVPATTTTIPAAERPMHPPHLHWYLHERDADPQMAYARLPPPELEIPAAPAHRTYSVTTAAAQEAPAPAARVHEAPMHPAASRPQKPSWRSKSDCPGEKHCLRQRNAGLQERDGELAGLQERDAMLYNEFFRNNPYIYAPRRRPARAPNFADNYTADAVGGGGVENPPPPPPRPRKSTWRERIGCLGGSCVRERDADVAGLQERAAEPQVFHHDAVGDHVGRPGYTAGSMVGGAVETRPSKRVRFAKMHETMPPMPPMPPTPAMPSRPRKAGWWEKLGCLGKSCVKEGNADAGGLQERAAAAQAFHPDAVGDHVGRPKYSIVTAAAVPTPPSSPRPDPPPPVNHHEIPPAPVVFRQRKSTWRSKLKCFRTSCLRERDARPPTLDERDKNSAALRKRDAEPKQYSPPHPDRGALARTTATVPRLVAGATPPPARPGQHYSPPSRPWQYHIPSATPAAEERRYPLLPPAEEGYPFDKRVVVGGLHERGTNRFPNANEGG